MTTLPPLPPPPIGAITDGEHALLRNWAETHGAACAAAERERCAKIADEHARRTYNWASENADIYRAQANWAEAIAKSIRQLSALKESK